MFQEIINNYFKPGVKYPLKKLVSSLKQGYGNSKLGFNFLVYLVAFFRFHKKYKSKLPKEYRINFEKGEEIGFDFETLYDLYDLLKLQNFTEEQRKQLTILFNQFYSYDKLKKDSYGFVEDAFKTCGLNNKSIRCINIIFSGEKRLNDENKNNALLAEYINKNQKLDARSIALMCRNFDLEKNKEAKKNLIQCFDKKLESNSDITDFIDNGFIDDEIISKEQMSEIINNINKNDDARTENNSHKINYDTFLSLESQLEKYKDENMIKDLKVAFKNKIDMKNFDIESQNDRQIIFDTDLFDNKKFEEIIRDNTKNKFINSDIITEILDNAQKRGINKDETNELEKNIIKNNNSIIVENNSKIIDDYFRLIENGEKFDKENKVLKSIKGFLHSESEYKREAYKEFFEKLRGKLLSLALYTENDITTLNFNMTKNQLMWCVAVLGCDESVQNSLYERIKNIDKVNGLRVILNIIKDVIEIITVLPALIEKGKPFKRIANCRLFDKLKNFDSTKQKISKETRDGN